MLQMILGRAFCGKTTWLLNKMEEVVGLGKTAVFMVPEQFTFETEKAILHRFGDARAAKIQVLSFTRLCDAVARECGGLCKKTLSDPGKIVLMNRALKNCAPEMKRWKKGTRQIGFASAMLDSVEEFKLNAVAPEDLERAANVVSSENLAEKLHDIARVYSCYNGLIENAFLDPSDRLTRLCDDLRNCRYFDGKVVFMDAFKSFTGQQYRVLEILISQCEDLYCALTVDPEHAVQSDLFQNVRQTENSLCECAKSHGVPVAQKIHLTKPFFAQKALAALEDVLAGGTPEQMDGTQAVHLVCAKNQLEEAEFCAYTIRKAVREQHYRYQDFLVVARNAEDYEEALLSACRRNGVNVYCARRFCLADFAPARAILCAFELANRMKSDALFQFYKCGFNCFSVEELSVLENYVTMWGIDGDTFAQDWKMNPDGWKTEADPMAEEELSKINALRKRAVLPIIKFQKSFCGSAQQRGAALVTLLTDCNAAAAFAKLANDFSRSGKTDEADALRQSWDQTMLILDELAHCFDSDVPDTEIYVSAFKNAVAQTSVGITPQTLDEVVFGSADRIRCMHPKAVYVLGCNQGVFPAACGGNGLLGNQERAELKAAEINIPDKTLDTAIDEDYLVYANLCCAGEQVFLSYSQKDSDGNKRSASSFIERIKKNIKCDYSDENKVSSICYYPETNAAALLDACDLLHKNESFANELFNALPDEFSDRVESLRGISSGKPYTLSREKSEKFFGGKIYASASSLDLFFKCPFRYFCKHTLKADSAEKVEINPLQRGTLVHFAVEQLCREFGADLGKQSDETVTAAVDRYIDDYLSKITDFFKIETLMMEYALTQIRRSAKLLALHLRDESAQAGFQTAHTEYSFGRDNPVRFDFENGEFDLRGSVDRVDIWDKYLRVIDYKTGETKFDLENFRHGISLQMVLYLYAMLHEEAYREYQPGGIIYLPALPKYETENLCGNGMILDDEAVRLAMEPKNEGRFVPKYSFTKQNELTKTAKESYRSAETFAEVFDTLESLLKDAGNRIISGDISVRPIAFKRSISSCEFCDFGSICGKRNEFEKMGQTENSDAKSGEVNG